MDKKDVLKEIFENDPFGILTVKQSSSSSQSEEERLLTSFQEIIAFYEANHREPSPSENIQEHQLYTRLKGIRSNPDKCASLAKFDSHGLLQQKPLEINSFDDIFSSDCLGLLNDDSQDIFTFKHVPKDSERASTDFVAKRKPCKNFGEYENLFKNCQRELKENKRKLIPFTEKILQPKEFYVQNGVLLYLESVQFEKEVQDFKSGSRVRKDGRTRIIFENGTESNMLYRSLYKVLLANGQAVSETDSQMNQEFNQNFNHINEEDKEEGFIYVLKSKSEKPNIRDISNLYKIGFTRIPIEERIKNAMNEPTYLMADVRIVKVYKCYNLNPQKLENLLHRFFGKVCLNVDVFDLDGQRHTPREWFIAPLDILDQAIHLIITGEIYKYHFDEKKEELSLREV
ncbi:T5orf172 domain protein [Leptospira wolbachii serovar Codice str. CDC]|uniref:T5orf172 domain protein n=1 Tax=Leptospira wolbachii serovar Codice str. CDC TaxID=1218599 RepID=R9A8Q8_9LEPT|nr:GIY-YIG nuclease family protein [Leptospira wolbachii]EOQ98541.1 T5orf172 domain protein [Leptospira wolbachii serovar Codice str. CDC]